MLKNVKNRVPCMHVDLLYNIKPGKLVFTWWLITFQWSICYWDSMQLVENIFSHMYAIFKAITEIQKLVSGEDLYNSKLSFLTCYK